MPWSLNFKIDVFTLKTFNLQKMILLHFDLGMSFFILEVSLDHQNNTINGFTVKLREVLHIMCVDIWTC